MQIPSRPVGMFRRLRRFFRADKAPSLSSTSPDDLRQHNEELRQELIQVTEGVYVAVGYGLANSIMLEGEDGVVIVDTLGTAEAAEIVRDAFRAITTKPVKAIIYTHNHSDHIFGAGVFAEGHDPKIYAHVTTSAAIDKIVSLLRPAIMRRSMRQFGVFVPESDFINAGIGPALETTPDSKLALLRPTHTYSDRLSLTIAGIEMELRHAPGETDDHTVIWLPQHKLLIAADNFYRSFPNLYAIRGTAHRDVMQWVRSLDLMLDYPSEYLVPCHTRPLYGAATIQQALRDYRDAIQFVHDQTVQGINEGLTPDEIVERVTLPPHLAASPNLQEFYGTVAWSVRAIFHGYLGWFSGNATDLSPLSTSAKAERMATLVGGIDQLAAQAQQAFDAADHQWALELADHVLRLEAAHPQARKIRVGALTALGSQQSSANGRNYYLTQAREVQGLAIKLNRESPLNIVHSIPLPTLFQAMAVNLDARKSADIDQCIGFQFTDTGETFTLHIRRGVAAYRPRAPQSPDIQLQLPSLLWKEIVAGVTNAVGAYATGKIKIEGGPAKLAKLLLLFKKPD